MLPTLVQERAALRRVERHSHVLVLFPKPADKKLPDVPARAALKAVAARRRLKAGELFDSPSSANLAAGTLIVWVAVDFAKAMFEQHSAVRKALQLLLDEHPREVAVDVSGNAGERSQLARLAVYAAWVNGVPLPERKKKSQAKRLERIRLSGYRDPDGFAALRAQAEGNVLVRELTVLPPNELTPGRYRARARKLAADMGWQREEYDLKRLRKMGAGAFCAVAQGSHDEDAAIVRLCYRGRGAKKTIALVGKGICFDTGGHNLKPARYMHGMHEDMNGSAVALGILLAATRAKLPVAINCWMALAQNHISPRAYKQNDVVTALNGTTIEVVHTDAEGRMVLADTLTLAARGKPELMIDFATLTGSMHVALGDRYSGVFATDDALAAQAVAAGRASGERVCVFPMDGDYDPALESKIADVKQCTLEGEADHILAVRFLKRFTADRPWIHMDLSASRCTGGLGAVASDVTGFGVAWGLSLLQSLIGN